MEHIGEILRTAREDNFYTQKKVIELTGINRKTLSGYENSVAEPDLDTFARLLRLYQLSADEVLGIKTCEGGPGGWEEGGGEGEVGGEGRKLGHRGGEGVW